MSAPMTVAFVAVLVLFGGACLFTIAALASLWIQYRRRMRR